MLEHSLVVSHYQTGPGGSMEVRRMGGEGWEEGGKKDGRGVHGQTGEFIRDRDGIVITTYINFPEDEIYNFPLQKKMRLCHRGSPFSQKGRSLKF